MAAIDVAFEMGRAARQPGQSAEALLHRLTMLTARLLPGCCGASLTVWEATRRVRSSVSHVDLAMLRELPRPASEDPERQAATRERVVTIPDALACDRWKVFCAGAAALGIRSAAFQPAAEGVRVTLGCYATEPHAFDGADLALLAGQAAAVLRDAEYHSELERDVHGLRASLNTRGVIDQAAGILMAERQCTAQQAFAELNRLSQNGNVKLADLARNLVGRRSAG